MSLSRGPQSLREGTQCLSQHRVHEVSRMPRMLLGSRWTGGALSLLRACPLWETGACSLSGRGGARGGGGRQRKSACHRLKVCGFRGETPCGPFTPQLAPVEHRSSTGRCVLWTGSLNCIPPAASSLHPFEVGP